MMADTENAIAAYQQVVEMAPAHLEARVALSVLFQQSGKQKQALEILMYGEPRIYIYIYMCVCIISIICIIG